MTYVDPYAATPACDDPEQAEYIRNLPPGGPYNKVNSPPLGRPWLMTQDGLKYWKEPAPYRPNWRYVATEDPSISLHRFDGAQGFGDNYLFNHKYGRIGFFGQQLVEGRPYPQYDHDRWTSSSGINVVAPITGIGTPVQFIDFFSHWKHEFIVIIPPEFEREFVTNITWHQYTDGKREKFKSKIAQDAAIKILPDLFTGLRLRLSELPSPDTRSAVQMRFHEKLWLDLMEGKYIEG